MEQFQSRFLDEATDLIDDLEEVLLEAQTGHIPEGFIEQVFRIMHSLKGSGAMFGYQKVSDFAHNLEELYDKIRNNELHVTDSIIELTLRSVDLFKSLLQSPDDPDIHQQANQLTQEVVNQTEHRSTIRPSISASRDSGTAAQKTFWVEFRPHSDIFDNGTNPLFVVDELVQLGQSAIVLDTSRIPHFSELIPSACYIAWYVLLATEKSEDEVREVFMFVDDLAQIDVQLVAERNVLTFEEIQQKIDWARRHPSKIDQDFVDDLAHLAERATQVADEENMRENLNEFNKRKQLSSIRVASDKIDTYLNLVSELVTLQTSLNILSERLKNDELSGLIEDLDHLSRNLRDNAISISLVPFATIFSRFQRLVHDLSREFNKEIELRAEGMETELDKTMIQTITDPLMHIIRNSIDHGIEKPAERLAKGKPRGGTITMRALHSGANIIIEVEDDGKGIDPVKIREAAIRKGFLDESVQLSEEETIKIILRPGFSTTEKATSVSGRGVGMDVVHQNVGALKGSLDIRSQINKGTLMRIRLPQSLSIIDGMMVNISDTLFVVPSMVLVKIMPVARETIEKAENKLLYIDQQHIPYLHLRREFDIQGQTPDQLEAVILEYETQRVAMIVDQVHNEYQVVLRPLGKFLKNSDLLLGASIIGEGTIALVLDTSRIIKQAIEKNRKTTKS